MTESFGTLIGRSWQYFKSHLTPIALGAVILALLAVSSQVFLERHVTQSAENQFGSIAELEELAGRIEQGDEEAFAEMMMQLGLEGAEVTEDSLENLKSGFFAKMIPAFVLFTLVSALLSIIANAYYLALVADGGQSIGPAFARVPRLILPLLCVWVLILLLSFLWIPFLGILLAIIIGPRLALAPVILVQEKAKIIESIKLSYHRTRGYWCKVVGNMLVVVLLLMVVSVIMGVLLSLLSTASPYLVTVLMQFVGYLTLAYATVFTVQLEGTITKNPKKTKKA